MKLQSHVIFFILGINKLYYFSSSDVKDIHDILEVTVFDEDKDHKYEFLGKVKVNIIIVKYNDVFLRSILIMQIPLLRIRNHDRRWYSLKDKKLRKHAKGDTPQIMLEMFFVYNKVRVI